MYKYVCILIYNFFVKIFIVGVLNGCMDLWGNLVLDGEVFVLNCLDFCRMCLCENGEIIKCNYIYCDVLFCEWYKLVLGICCGFICLENINEFEGIVSNE